MVHLCWPWLCPSELQRTLRYLCSDGERLIVTSVYKDTEAQRELNDLSKVTQAGDSGGWALSCSASSGVDSRLREGLRKLRQVWFLIGKEARNQGVGCGAHSVPSVCSARVPHITISKAKMCQTDLGHMRRRGWKKHTAPNKAVAPCILLEGMNY